MKIKTIVDAVLCYFGWHVPNCWYKNAFQDGINRPHAHVPLFGAKKTTIYIWESVA